MRAVVAAAVLISVTTMAAFAADEEPEHTRIVATTGMIADIVRNVGGKHVEVRQLLGAGVDPHLYKATRSDVSAMIDADAVFYNGLLLEGKMSDALVRIATAGKPVFAVTELIDESYLVAPDGAAGLHDPHVWMDARAWSKAIDVVRDRLSEIAPAHKATFRENADKFQSDIARLDAYVESIIASIPPERRILITAHDAFHYFGKRYGIEVHGIQGISTESEAGLKAIEELVGLIVEKKIPAIFGESTISTRSVEALVAGAKSKGHDVKIAGSLFSDAMGPPGTYEGTYIGMIDHNATTIATALGGKTPAKGLNDRLAMGSAEGTK
ncbi:MAG: zinc ABC transporter substrate-binding protein [Hyphomicrobium sp.]|nr:zinc ABC transporter substrate-binding protein [Hyphomicrobium sp.]